LGASDEDGEQKGLEGDDGLVELHVEWMFVWTMAVRV
jgi:hypothetical protein